MSKERKMEKIDHHSLLSANIFIGKIKDIFPQELLACNRLKTQSKNNFGNKDKFL